MSGKKQGSQEQQDASNNRDASYTKNDINSKEASTSKEQHDASNNRGAIIYNKYNINSKETNTG